MIVVKGNGNIISVEKPVSSFIRLHLGVKGEVEIIQGEEEKVIIEADENLLDFFEINNAGRTLYITSDGKLRSPAFTHVNVKVYFRQINNLYHFGQGNVFSGNMLQSADPLEVKIHAQGNTDLQITAPLIRLATACQGDVRLKGKCEELNIKLSSQGDLDCSEMIANHVQLRNMSQGNIKLYSQESIIIKNYGEGNVHYSGPGILKDILQYGSGELKHK